MKHKIALMSAVLIMLFGLFVTANAQQKGTQQFPFRLKGKELAKAIEITRAGRSQASPEIVKEVEEAYAQEKTKETFYNSPLVGTWYITVPGATPAENLYAYQTFGSDGIFVETSSLLGRLPEGPAHGVWESRGYYNAVLTFELFAFDENGGLAGRIRVRNAIRLPDNNHFTSNSAVDFIDLNGDVTENIATGPFTGERVQIRGL